MNLVIIHPAWQVVFTLLGLYAAWLGLKRLRSLHLGRSVAFPRSRHILVGKATLVGIILGAVGGAVMVRWMWRGWLVTGPHAWLGVAVVVLALAGLAMGLYLERHPGGSKGLSLTHGLVNLLVLALCLVQFYLGDHILDALGD
ncbi:MAG: DUF4079 family protein [Desulfarculaceae bacterium]|nr:DUF4079 family protein [Desulfarculaceae bacterium]MCF8072006.1 DUF4079 family protein [Desulfarculaceae bacterium]MCF8101523.1 DUF4079 family protein [Desulfarculaceae bacterium]MCF8115073.1 DUF4079 family protein [Desulfarculaceae bacterium]